MKPEKNNFYSLNAEYNYRRLSVSVTGFINDIRDMINYRTLSDQEIHDMGLDDKHATSTRYASATTWTKPRPKASA